GVGEEARRIPTGHHPPPSAAPPRRWTDARDRPRAGTRLTHGAPSQRQDLAPVLVTRRQMTDERVLDGDEAELGEELGALGTDAGEIGERRLGPRGGPRRGSTRGGAGLSCAGGSTRWPGPGDRPQ